jgi:hypothetical protein
MTHLDLELQGISADELERHLKQLGIDLADHKIIAPKMTSGDVFVDLIIKLSHIELNALSLLVGYAIGKGLHLFALLKGVRQAVDTLEEAKRLLETVQKQDAKKSSERDSD